MRWLWVPLIVWATVLTASAEDWTTADGKTYRNVVVISQEDEGVRITYTGGVGIIPYYELPLDLQKRFGEDYDSLLAKRKAAEKALEEANRKAAEAAATAAEQKKQEDAAAAALAKTHPGPNTPGGNPPPVAPPVAPSGAHTQPVAQPSVSVQPNQPAEDQSSQAARVEVQALYPGSKYSYDENADICYLDSPAVELWPVLAEAAPAAASTPGQNPLLILRIVTEGHKPETPDTINASFLSNLTLKEPIGNRNVKFLVDGVYLHVSEMENLDNSFPSGAGHIGSIFFSQSPEQARLIIKGKNVNFSVGSSNYRIDDTGISTLQKYFADVNRLPPASTNFVRAYHKFINRLPSIITMISTVCEYIILGSFAILLAASIAAFVMGITRFIKM